MNCPRCSETLQESTFGEAPVSMCPGCLGTLVHQGKLIPLMEELSRDMMGSIDFDHPIDKSEHDGGQATCPKCAKPMERFGYMGTNLVYAWRCGADWLVWADTEPLGVMAVLYARTKTRRESREAQVAEEQEALNRRVNALIRQRIRTNLITMGAGF